MEEYKELGLTVNEGKAYETLLNFGKLSVGDISKHSGVSYSKIYNVLGSLTKKGLAEIVPEKTKKFVPSSPESLFNLIDEKKKQLESLKEKVKEMKRKYEIKEKNPVIMGMGKTAFYKIVKELKETKKYDYSLKWTSEAKPDWIGKFRKNVREGKDIKTLTRYDKETKKDIEEWIKINRQMRAFPNEGVAMSICDDQQVMIALIKSNVTLVINDIPFAKIMKKFFLDSYARAEPIKED